MARVAKKLVRQSSHSAGRMAVVLMAIISLMAMPSCGSTSSAPPTSPDPVVSRPAPDVPTPLQATTKCWGPFRPGERVPLACVVLVTAATGPGSTNIRAFADLSAFGPSIYGTTWELIQCPACGSPTFDMDLHVPDDMMPGPKTFPVWATDGQGRRADTTGTLEIRSR